MSATLRHLTTWTRDRWRITATAVIAWTLVTSGLVGIDYAAGPVVAVTVGLMALGLATVVATRRRP